MEQLKFKVQYAQAGFLDNCFASAARVSRSVEMYVLLGICFWTILNGLGKGCNDYMQLQNVLILDKRNQGH